MAKTLSVHEGAESMLVILQQDADLQVEWLQGSRAALPTPVCMSEAMEHSKHLPNHSQLSAPTAICFPAGRQGPVLKADAVSGEIEGTT